MENYLSKSEVMVVIAALRKVMDGDYKIVGARASQYVEETLNQFYLTMGRIVTKEAEEKVEESGGPITGEE